MKYRSLGSTGLEVSVIGFGTWGLGGNSYGPVDDVQSIAALKRAFELGITFYDTSDLYGNGHSEVILGKALGTQRSKIVIGTKGGTLPHSGFQMPQDFSPTYIRDALDASLKRLGTDYVDLYQLHSPQLTDIENPELHALLEKLKAEGKIREYGISVRAPKDGIHAINAMQFKAVQANLNLIDHRVIESGLSELVQKKGVGFIARTPLCFGFLTGDLNEKAEFTELDHRRLWPKEQLKRWSDAVALFEKLYKKAGNTPAQLALRFCLSVPGVATVIPGMMNSKEVEENAAAADMPLLNAEEQASVEHIYATHQFYDPKAKGL
jgi:aryl-alcohol dehydrogenase-like predicted oxidoreductase